MQCARGLARRVFSPISGLLDLLYWLFGSVTFSLLQVCFVLVTSVRLGVDLALLLVARFVRKVTTIVVLAKPWRVMAEYRIYKYSRTMHRATTYEEWAAAADALDREMGNDLWRAADESTDYDYQLVKRTTAELRRLREADSDIHDIQLMLRTVLNRSFGGMGNQRLYARAHSGTKHLVEDAQREIAACLEHVAESPTLSFSAKASFFDSARRALGRSALCLSGGGALSMGHLGVVRALILQNALPRVISGTSGGSIGAAMLACKTDQEMIDEVCQPSISNKYGVRWFEPVHAQVMRFAGTFLTSDGARMMENDDFARTCRAYWGDTTFEEAFQRTGRMVSITITVSSRAAPRAAHPLVLNYLTAPTVLLWSAVAASCALPGLMRPVTLMAKRRDGSEAPYHPAGVHTMDGSVHSDIPSEALAQLMNVQRFIVSQVNPHITPFLRATGAGANPRRNNVVQWCDSVERYVNISIQAKLVKLAKLRLIPRLFGVEIGSVVLQKYRGHITITPNLSVFDQFKALSHPSERDMRVYLLQGARAAWPAMAAIKGMLALEQAVDKAARAFPYSKRVTSPSVLRASPTLPAVLDAEADSGAGATVRRAEEANATERGDDTVRFPAFPPPPRRSTRAGRPRLRTPLVDPLSGIGAAVLESPRFGSGSGTEGDSATEASESEPVSAFGRWGGQYGREPHAADAGAGATAGAKPLRRAKSGGDTHSGGATGAARGENGCEFGDDSYEAFWSSSRSWFVSDGTHGYAGGISESAARRRTARRARSDTL